jgi:regulator of chromosome condensation
MITAEYLRILKDIQALYHRPTGELMAMGSDDCCALGISLSNDDEKEGEYPPTFSRNLPHNMIQVEAGGLHSVALTEDGRVFTFGQNDDNALGRVMEEDAIHLAGEVVSLPPSAQGRIVMIAAGDNHSLFLDIDGQVYMCGMYKDIDSGKFANVQPGEKLHNGTSQPVPIRIPFPQPVRKIVAGHSSNAAILADDSLYTWGKMVYAIRIYVWIVMDKFLTMHCQSLV